MASYVWTYIILSPFWFGDSFIDAAKFVRMVIAALLVVVSAVASMTSADPIFNLLDLDQVCEECDNRTDLISELLCALVCEDDSDESDSDESDSDEESGPSSPSTGETLGLSSQSIGETSDSSSSTIVEYENMSGSTNTGPGAGSTAPAGIGSTAPADTGSTAPPDDVETSQAPSTAEG